LIKKLAPAAVVLIFSFLIVSCPNVWMEQLLDLRIISFDTGGGSSVSNQVLLRGDRITKPADPARANFLFTHWLDKDGDEWDFDIPPVGSMTLYADWVSYGISLSQNSVVFGSLEVGYSVPLQAVTVENIGDSSTGNLTISLSPTDAFTVSTSSLQSLLPGQSYDIIVGVLPGLAIGTYTATVTITNGSDITVTIPVSLTFTPEPTVWVTSPTHGTSNVPFSDLKTALDSITTAGDYTVTLANPLTYSLAPYTRPFPNGSDISFSLASGFSPATVQLLSPGSLFTITDGVNLTLNTNVFLFGIDNNNAALVQINSGGTLTLSTGAINHNKNSGNGGGVFVNGGTFIIDNGSILGNEAANGGGVFVNSGTLTMNGGLIQTNDAVMNGGGVYVDQNGTFNMTNGTISLNFALLGSGVFLDGNAVFNLSGGNINNELCVNVYSSLYLSGTANIGVLTLIASSSSVCSRINIIDTYSGTVNSLDLRGSINVMSSVVSYWVGNTVIQGSGGYTLLEGDLARFTPRNFVAVGTVEPTRSIAATHTIILNTTNNAGELHITPLGTINNPFYVTNEAELRQVGRGTGTYSAWTLSAYYKLIASFGLNNDWIPIPGEFTGEFDGNGNVLSGLIFSNTEEDQGMFTVLGETGTVRNLGLVNVNITGGQYVGGIVGLNRGRVQNCFVTGFINGSSNVGGIVGWNTTSLGRVENCVALHESITAANGIMIGRISPSLGILQNNYARSNMIVTLNGTWNPNKTTTTIDGADITNDTLAAARACLAIFGTNAPVLNAYLP